MGSQSCQEGIISSIFHRRQIISPFAPGRPTVYFSVHGITCPYPSRWSGKPYPPPSVLGRGIALPFLGQVLSPVTPSVTRRGTIPLHPHGRHHPLCPRRRTHLSPLSPGGTMSFLCALGLRMMLSGVDSWKRPSKRSVGCK